MSSSLVSRSGFPYIFRLLFGPRSRPRWTAVDVAILIAWIAVVLFLISHHALWRDEVRALSIALDGDDVFAMLTGLHGEGHPAVWYLLLRGAYVAFGRVEMLQAAAFIVALGTTALIVFLSPFPRLLVLVLISGRMLLHEFPVIARNYGIAALLLFAIAACYRRYRERGIVLGVLLFLLANTNLVAAIMVGGFLLFWLLDLVEEGGVAWTPPLRNFAVNAVIATVGVLVCALTILPTVNDAAARDWSTVSPVAAAIGAIVNPGTTDLGRLLPQGVAALVATLLIYGSILGLSPRRPAFVAALVALVVCALFFALAAAGRYRHAAIWLAFLISLYWICWRDTGERLLDPGVPWRRKAVPLAGALALITLLAAQSLRGLDQVRAAAAGEVQSRSADFARLVGSRPDLADAVIVAEPDYLAEAIPYYLPNATYLIREERFGNVVTYSRSGRLATDLGEVLRVARALQQSTAGPVLVILEHRLDRVTPGRVYREGYNWTFSATAAQIDEFRAATTLLESFGPAERETFDVYLLN